MRDYVANLNVSFNIKMDRSEIEYFVKVQEAYLETLRTSGKVYSVVDLGITEEPNVIKGG